MGHAAVSRHQTLSAFMLLFALLPVDCAPWDAFSGGPAGECPEGFYRTAAIIFGCEHTRGTAHSLLAPAATTSVVNIPRGVQNFTITARADTGIGLKLATVDSGTNIVDSNSRRPGIITNSRRTGTFEGMPITLSGDDADTTAERLEMHGMLPAPTVLRFSNSDSGWGTVAMNYSHGGIDPCPVVPEGCELYDEDAARLEVVDWSQWAQSKYESADEAWLIRGAPYAKSPSGGIYWYSWPAVWSRHTNTPTRLDDQDWQPAFHWVDSDNNGEVSQSEFEVGYDAATYGGRQSLVSTIMSSVTATTSSTFTSTVPKLLANHTLPSLPAVQEGSSWVEHNRWWLLAAALVFLTAIGVAGVILLGPRRRKRGVRSVRSRDSDGQLEISDTSISHHNVKDLNESYSANLTDTSIFDSSVEAPPPWVPKLFMPLLSPFWRMEALPELWRSPNASPFSSGHAWVPTIRYGPLPTADDMGPCPQLRPGQAVPMQTQVCQGTPTSPLLRTRDLGPCQRSPSVASVPMNEQGSVSLSVQNASSFGPLKVIQASPEQLESLRTAPKVHIGEKSQSFASVPGQESISKVDYKAHSYSVPGSPPQKASPGSPATQQAPWAAVFTPEEWSRATQSGAQQTQSPKQAPRA